MCVNSMFKLFFHMCIDSILFYCVACMQLLTLGPCTHKYNVFFALKKKRHIKGQT